MKGIEDDKVDCFCDLEWNPFELDYFDHYWVIGEEQIMKVTIVVMGGVVHEVYAPVGTEIELIDFDNPSKDISEPDGETCPQETIEEIEAKIRDSESE